MGESFGSGVGWVDFTGMVGDGQWTTNDGRWTMDDCFDGIRVATAELKNPMTGQTWRTALRQHLNARDPNIDALC